MVNEYSVPRISLISSFISSQIIKALILYFVNGVRHIFPQKHRTWSERLRVILRSFLKLESFGCNNYNGDFFNQHYFRKHFRTLLLLKLIKKFLHAVCHGKKWLKLNVYIVNHKENVHGKQSLMIIKLFIVRSVNCLCFIKSI